ncbi:MAG: 3'-5' exonuclease [Ferruginibacter sp.]|nr:3'-5' exonuclease [Cytophagales bacterium]
MDPSFQKRAKNLLFLSLETVSAAPSYELLDATLQRLWDKRAGQFHPEEIGKFSPRQLFTARANLYAEFGKIISIGVGYFHPTEGGPLNLRAKTFVGDDEKSLLEEFKLLLETKFDPKNLVLCAHNGKEFHYPYLCRRMLLNGITIPKPLQIVGKKPWEIPHLDTLELWRFGDRRTSVSLELLATLFDVPSDHLATDGTSVNRMYYVEKDWSKIRQHSLTEIAVLAQLYLKLNNLPTITAENIFLTE